MGGEAFGEGVEGVHEVEGGSAEQHRDHSHSVGNLKYACDVDPCQRSSNLTGDREFCGIDREDDDPEGPVAEVAGEAKSPDVNLI